jgi:hypothetical protein
VRLCKRKSGYIDATNDARHFLAESSKLTAINQRHTPSSAIGGSIDVELQPIASQLQMAEP